VKVLVLGGGSTGEHFVGALRRLDAEAEITLVESRLVGGERSYFACLPTKARLPAAELSSSPDRAPGPAPGSPGARSSEAPSSVVRSIVFVGMQAKYEHSPPASPRSTMVIGVSGS